MRHLTLALLLGALAALPRPATAQTAHSDETLGVTFALPQSDWLELETTAPIRFAIGNLTTPEASEGALWRVCSLLSAKDLASLECTSTYFRNPLRITDRGLSMAECVARERLRPIASDDMPPFYR